LAADQHIAIRELTAADVAAYRGIRLEGLRLAPEAFGSFLVSEMNRWKAVLGPKKL